MLQHQKQTLKQRRIELGLTQKELADKAGVGLSTIERLERVGYTAGTLYDICNALKLQIEFKPKN